MIYTEPQAGGVASSSPVEDGFMPSTFHDRFQVEAEYLLWFVRVGNRPQGGLVGATTVADVINSRGGALQNLQALPNNAESFDFGGLSGLRLSGVGYLDDDQSLGLDSSWFTLFQACNTSSFASAGDPVLGPLFRDADGTQTLVIAALPSSASFEGRFGRAAEVRVSSDSETWGFDINARMRVPTVTFVDRVFIIGGLRYLQFEESFSVNTNSFRLPGNAGADAITINDYFGARNQFLGAQLGLQTRTQFGPLSLDVALKGAIGGVNEQLRIRGDTTIITGPDTTRHLGGVLAQRTNIGNYDSTRTALLGEFSLRGGYNFNERLRATVGYNLISMTNVVRVGNAIDVVDSRGIPVLNDTIDTNAQRPVAPTLAESHWWVQGLTLGLDLSF